MATLNEHSDRSRSALPLVLLFLAIVADGFDAAALSFAIPTLSREWSLTPSDFTLPLVATNVGAVVGYMLCSRLTARFGRRTVVWASVLFYSTVVVATVVVTTIPLLAAVRFLTGLGLGAVLPAAVSLAVDLVPPRRREAAAVGITLGLATGATVSGLVGGKILAGLGWEAVFWIPGGLAVLLSALLWWTLPQGDALPGDVAPRVLRAGVAGLFAAELRWRTVLLWALAFLVFVTGYILLSWMPTFLSEYGFTSQQAPLGTAAYGFGGLVGGVVLAILATFFGAPRVVVVMSGLAVALLVVIARVPLGTVGLLVVIGLAGAGASAAMVGQSAMAVGIYDGASRTVGVAWAAALGRIGSIVGPAVGGLLLAVEMPASQILLITAVPLALGCVLAALFVLAMRRSAAEGRANAVAAATAGDAACAGHDHSG